MSPQTDRCTGHCCKAFNLNMERLKADYHHAMERRRRHKRLSMDDKEAIQIFEMIVPLPPTRVGPHGNPHEPLAMITPDWHAGTSAVWYRCKNVKENGDCGIYEKRPSMCSRYPNESACLFIRCTSRAARHLRSNEYTGATPHDKLIPVRALVRFAPFRANASVDTIEGKLTVRQASRP